MLNEQLEYENYLKIGYDGLLKERNLKDGLSGFSLPLTVLARGINEKLFNAKLPLDTVYLYCTEFLTVWLKGDFESSEHYAEIEKMPEIFEDFKKADACNFKNHLKSLDPKIANALLTAEDKKAVDPIASFIKTKIDLFSKSMFSHGNQDNKNQIFFQDIFADALLRGNLKDQALVVKKNFAIFKNNDFGILNYNRPTQPRSPTEAQLLKIFSIAFFYLKALKEGQTFAPICKSEIANYLDVRTDAISAFTNDGIYLYKENNQSIFQYDYKSGKLTVNKQWLEMFDVRLVSRGEEYPDGYILLTDKILRKN